MSKATLDVSGMTCGACEARITRRLSKIPGVTRVDASAVRGQVVVTSDRPVRREVLNRAVEEAGYGLGRTRLPWLSTSPVVWRDVTLTVIAVFLLALVVGALGGGSLFAGALDGVQTGSLAAVALLGLAAGFSSCMALVGGLVLSLSARSNEARLGESVWQRLAPQFGFNLGRIVGFFALGAVLGLVGSAFTMSRTATGVAMGVAALVMGYLGLRLAGVFPRLSARPGFSLPGRFGAWLSEPDADVGLVRGGVLGALTFFLPCGFTQAVQVLALATGSPMRAGLIMATFALGTAPGLLGVGSVGALLGGKGTFFRVAGVVTLAFALVNAAGALTLLGVSFSSTPPATTLTENVVDTGTEQVLTMTVENAGYTPENSVVYAGEPVRWEITNNALTCATFLKATDVGVADAYLTPGETTTLEFTLAEPGTYRFTCTMGMYAGTITAIPRPE